MDGMGMLLKTFGFDPEAMKATAEAWMKSMQATVNHFVKRHDTHDAALARIEAKLDVIAAEHDRHMSIYHFEPSSPSMSLLVLSDENGNDRHN